MSISTLYGLTAAIWLLSFTAALLGLWWTFRPGQRWRWAALVSSCLALAVSYFGLSRLHLAVSRTTNGRLDWSINSKWFFLVSLMIGAVALILTLWHWRKAGIPAPPEA